MTPRLPPGGSWGCHSWSKKAHRAQREMTTLMVESKEELKRLLMKVKEESEKVGLELNIRSEEHSLNSSHTLASRMPSSA